MIGRVGKMLRLQAKGAAAVVSLAFLALDRSIEEVTCIELDTGLRGRNVKDSAGGWLVYLGRRSELSRSR